MILLVNTYNHVLKEFTSLEHLYSILSDLYTVDIISLDSKIDYINDIALNDFCKYSYICFYIEKETAQFVFSLIQNIKNLKDDIKVFVVGPFATLSADQIIEDCPEIDYIVLGDYEIPIKNYLVGEQDGDYFYSKGDCLAAKKQFVFNMNDYHMVDHVLLKDKHLKKLPIAGIEAARGCVGRCYFCTQNYCLNKKRIVWRGRKNSDVFNEIVKTYEQYGTVAYQITDSALESPGSIGKNRIHELCDLLLQYPQKFTINFNTRAKGFCKEDRPLLDKMKKAGFLFALLGVESFDNNDLCFYNKQATQADNVAALDLLLDCGFYLDCGFINLNPLSTAESIKTNYQFSKKYCFFYDYHFNTKLSINYGSEMYTKAKDLGLLKDTYSYIDTLEYYYLNPDAAYIAERLSYANRLSLYHGDEMKYIDFKSCFISVMSVYDEEMVYSYKQTVTPLIKELSDIKFDMFYEIIYSDRDIAEIMNKYNPLIQKGYADVNIISRKLSKDKRYLLYLVNKKR